MGVRSRTVMLVTATAIILWLAMGSVATIYAFRTANETDSREASGGLNSSAAAIKAEQKRLVTICGDWAPWDDSYEFIRKPSDSYIQRNLPDETLLNLGVDFMILVDRTGSIVYAKSLDPVTQRAAALPDGLVRYLGAGPGFLRLEDPTAVASGALSLPEGPYLIAAQPIGKSDFSVAPNGTLVTGFRIGDETLLSIRELTTREITVYSSTAPSMPPDVRSAWSALGPRVPKLITMPDDERILAYMLVDGIEGTPGLIMRVAAPRTARNESRKAIIGVGLAMTAFGLLVVMVLGAVLDRTVLKRLTTLSSAVRDIGHSAAETNRIPVMGGDEIGGLAVDINHMLDELGRFQSELSYLVEHDPLTGLFNRRSFERELQREVDAHERLGISGAVLWFDLDHFKDINDTLGHAVGDELLRVFGQHLRQVTRADSIVARLGGDEFGMLIPHADHEAALNAASRLVAGFSRTAFAAANHDLRVSASAGIVMYPEHGRLTTELLARADIAMYDAKAQGGNQVVTYVPGDVGRREMVDRIEAAERILSALREDRMLLHAQPIRSAVASDRQGFELLLRMRDEAGELVYPDKFIPTAERLGLIGDIHRWLARRAIRLLALAQAEGRDVQFSINFSGSAFGDTALLDVIRSEFETTGASPERLIVEITETTTIADIEAACTFIVALRSIGCRFSLDDFGSKESSYYYLKHLPIDFLKIDGSLVTGLSDEPSDAPFVSAIVETCRRLNIETVAEYVESATALEAINLAGVDHVQGYHVGVPEPLEVYLGPQFAESNRGWEAAIGDETTEESST